MSNSHSNILEKELDNLYKEVSNGQLRGEKVGRWRRFGAYFLKVVAAGGSLVVATGMAASFHQQIGIAILVAIFVDTVSSNHSRLMAEVEAGYAFRALKSRVRGDFNRELGGIQDKVTQEDAQALEQYNVLMKQAHSALSDGIAEIREKLEKADIEALKSLSLDQERASLQK